MNKWRPSAFDTAPEEPPHAFKADHGPRPPDFFESVLTQRGKDAMVTWEDMDEDRGLLRLFERGPKPEGADLDRFGPVPHLRVVVEGETFIAFLDPRLEAIESARDDEGTYEVFVATDAYDAIAKAQRVVAEREAAKKRQRRTKKRA